MQELLADQVALLASERGELGDLPRDRALLLQRERHRRDRVGELGPGRVDARDRDGHTGVEQVLDHHHRVVSLLDRLPVEVRRERGSVSAS